MKYPWSRSNLIAVTAKTETKERFFEVIPLKSDGEYIYNKLLEAKVGHISIKQVSGNKVGFTMSGVTATFVEGLSLFIDNDTHFYYTSVVEKINWEEGYFDTLNSRYEFTFEPIPEDEL